MKVAVVAPSPVPFALGGAERLFHGLANAINELTPHDAELIKLPSREHNLPDLMATYRAFSELDLDHFDLLVSSKYPSWMVAHPNHVVYMTHTLRGLYDTYPAHLAQTADLAAPELAPLSHMLSQPPQRAALAELFGAFASAVATLGPGDPAFAFPGPLARQLVHWLDRVGLEPPAVQRHLAISHTVAGRKEYFPPQVSVGVVYPPSTLQGLHEGRFDHLFTASRIDGAKRIDLLVEAMRHVSSNVRLKVAGTGPDLDRLRDAARHDPRVELLGFVPDDQLAGLYADALAVPFVPFDEDLGLITIEAMACGKPVLTTVDAGGPTEFVEHGRTGLVVRPEPEAIGAAIDLLATAPAMARQMGAAARQRVVGIDWASVVTAIVGTSTSVTEPRPAPATKGRFVNARRRARPQLLVLSTFPIHPRRGGGQLRCYHLYKRLARHFDVTVLSLAGVEGPAGEFPLTDGFREVLVPKSARHEDREREITAQVGVPITDIAAGFLMEDTPDYLDAARRFGRQASAVLLSHPFLHPVLAMAGLDAPVFYDALNAEIALKEAVLPDNDTGRRLVETVRQVEGASVRDALAVSVCSPEDEAVLDAAFGVEGKAVLVPNGVDVSEVPFTPPAARAAYREAWLRSYRELTGLDHLARIAVFTGSWHPPNIEAAAAVIDFADQLPDVAFLLMGGHTLEFLPWRLPANVALLGIVSDIEKQVVLQAADVALNPMLSGSGTNLKMLEYFAAGCPVVSTPVGARGIAIEPGEHYVRAEIGELPAAIERVTAAPAEQDRMVRAARALVESRYDWPALGQVLLDAVLSGLAQGSARAS